MEEKMLIMNLLITTEFTVILSALRGATLLPFRQCKEKNLATGSLKTKCRHTV